MTGHKTSGGNGSETNAVPRFELKDLNPENLKKRQLQALLFRALCFFGTSVALSILAFLVFRVFHQGADWLSFSFLDSFPSRFPEKAGIKSALYGTFWLLCLTSLIAVPIGVGAAIYLEEIMFDSKAKRLIDLNITNLAGVPSIVYGILGLAIFVRFLGFERSVLAGSMTLAVLILPIIIVASREAIKAVPDAIRHAAFAVGATRLQTARDHVLPVATPGILTGVILSISRAIGETAPLIMIGALTYIAFVPEGPMDEFTALPIQIFNWVSRPQESFHALAAAGIIVLLTVLLGANSLAIYIRNKYQRNNLCNLL